MCLKKYLFLFIKYKFKFIDFYHRYYFYDTLMLNLDIISS